MNRLATRVFALVAGGLVSIAALHGAEESAVYELRVYRCEPGRLPALHARFRDHTTRLFEKHGMTNVAYFTPTEGDDADNTLVYVLRHKSREAAAESWAAFRADPEWQQARAASEQDGKILAAAPESTFLSVTDYSPAIEPGTTDKLYELRTYTAAEGKLDALHARFRDHTIKIFTNHGMRSLGYWVPMDEPQSGTTLIYLLEHKDREAADASWKAFSQDPDWIAARDASQVNGRLVSGVKRHYLSPTDYSPTAKEDSP